MGRDYPVELVLDTLCKNGFAKQSRYRAGQSNRGSHPCRGVLLHCLYSSDGQGFEPWVPIFASVNPQLAR
jgi:hypothetical protein